MKIKLQITQSDFVFYGFALMGLAVAFLSAFLLPSKYFSDARIIVNNTWNLKGFLGSYEFSIFFYNITRMKYLPFPIVALIQYPIVIFLLLKICRPAGFHYITLPNVLMYFSFFILAIYLSMPSKDFLTFLFCTLIVFLIRKNKHVVGNRILIGIFLIIFAVIFRVYFIIVLILSILFSLLHQIKVANNLYNLLIKGLLAAIFISLAFGVVKGKYISDMYRTELNAKRFQNAKIREEAKTAIVSPLPTNTWYGEAVSVLDGFVVVNIPFKSVFSLSPQVILFSLWQIFLFIYLFIRFNKRLKIPDASNWNWAYYITFAFFLVQGMFEPDLGSSIKHKAGIFPFIYFILFYETCNKNILGKN